MARNNNQATTQANFAAIAAAATTAAATALAPAHKYEKRRDMSQRTGSTRFAIAAGCENNASTGNGKAGKPTVHGMVAHATLLAMQASGKPDATGYEIGAQWATLFYTDARMEGLAIGKYTEGKRYVPCMAWLDGYITGGCRAGYLRRA